MVAKRIKSQLKRRRVDEFGSNQSAQFDSTGHGNVHNSHSSPSGSNNNTVKYSLYILNNNCSPTSSFSFPINGSQSNSSSNCLKLRLNQINDFIYKFTSKYVWEKDSFKLNLVDVSDSLNFISNNTTQSNTHGNVNNADSLSYLSGQCRVGDSMTDIHFIVFLLREITKSFTDMAATYVYFFLCSIY
jgi:hypothetical protein